MSQNTKTKGQQSVRQNVSTACTACRVSKLKCDGNQPTCGRCESKRKKCIYQAQDDKRRLNAHFMVPFKRALDIFVRRVRQLEPLFQQHGLDLPPVHDEDRAIYEKMIHGYEANSIPPSGTVQGSTGRDQDIIVGVDGTYPLHQPESLSLAVEMPLELDDIPTETTSVFPANSRTQAFPATETTMAAPETEQEARATDFGLDWIDWVDCQLGIDPTSSSSLADITSLDVSHSSTSITTGAAYDNNTLGNNEASEDEKELVFQLSDRMGHLHLMENGQSRFFGATSNFGLTKWKTTSDFGSFPSAQSPGSSVRCATSENADSALESLLEALYFSWADPAFHVVDREMYSHGKSLWQKGQESSPFYSPLLQYAICAYGCLLHDPRRKFESLAREYIGKLKELLEIELDCPKVATVQALVILSTFEAASAREARGWLYSGMAMRVSFDLGLHIDLGPYISNGEMSNAEANARSIAFWGCYIVDHLWGFYLGRPFQTNTGNITIQKPFMDNSHATPQWNPVGLERPSLTRDTLTNTSDQVDLIARQWVFLCESMDALGNIMYGSKSASAEDLLSVANRTVVELREWKSALSMELQIDAEDMSQCPLPHLILLHMQYYQILIYVHRPFLYKDRTSPSLPQNCELRDPRAVCLDSAVMIAKLVRMYERLYTLRRINIQAVSIIFSAGLLLVFESLSITHTHDLVDIISYLETCSQALAEVGEYYENASRSLDLLLKIKRDWKARIISHSSFVPKRHRDTQSAIGEPSNKYLRLHNQGDAGCEQHSGEQLARQGMDLYNGMVYAYGIYKDS